MFGSAVSEHSHFACLQDLDAYQDDDDNNNYDNEDIEAHDGQHYFPAAPSGWDDPGNSEVPPPYTRQDSDPQDYNALPNISRGESFMSTPMIVWGSSEDDWMHFSFKKDRFNVTVGVKTLKCEYFMLSYHYLFLWNDQVQLCVAFISLSHEHNAFHALCAQLEHTDTRCDDTGGRAEIL